MSGEPGLDRFHRVLSLYIEAFAAAPIPLLTTGEAPAALALVHADLATSDGSTIYLPELARIARDGDDLDYYKAAILFQLAHYEYGTLSFDLARLETQLAARKAPLTQARLRAPSTSAEQSELGRFFDNFQSPASARRLFTRFEILRLSARIEDRYRGFAGTLGRLRSAALRDLETHRDGERVRGESPVIEWLVRRSLERDPGPLFDSLGPNQPPDRDWSRVLEDLARWADALEALTSTVYTTAIATLDVYPWLDNPSETDLDQPREASALDLAVAFQGGLRPDIVQRRLALRDRARELLRNHGSSTSRDDEEAARGAITEVENLRPLVDADSFGLLALLDQPDAELALDPGPERDSAGGDSDAATGPITGTITGTITGPVDGAAERGAAGGDSSAATETLEGPSTESTSSDASKHPADLARALSRELKTYAADRDVFVYPEWDRDLAGYRQRWCALREHGLDGGDAAFVDEALARHHQLLGVVKRQFAALRPAALRHLRRLENGDDLDLDRLIEALVDRRAGRPLVDDIHRRRQRQERDVTAVFLLDMSASTDSPVIDPAARVDRPAGSDDGDRPVSRGYDFVDILAGEEPHETMGWLYPQAPMVEPRRRVIDVEKEAMALMAEALETLGDRYAIYGFSGYGRRQVDCYVVKELDETWDTPRKARLGALAPRQSTRMGAAIRHAVAKLEGDPARTRVLVVVSDGYPQDCDYGPDRSSPAHGIADTMIALREAHRLGIATFCLTVDPAGHDYLREMCPEERYLVIDEVAALPAELLKVYRGLTGLGM